MTSRHIQRKEHSLFWLETAVGEWRGKQGAKKRLVKQGIPSQKGLICFNNGVRFNPIVLEDHRKFSNREVRHIPLKIK